MRTSACRLELLLLDVGDALAERKGNFLMLEESVTRWLYPHSWEWEEGWGGNGEAVWVRKFDEKIAAIEGVAWALQISDSFSKIKLAYLGFDSS